MKVSYANLHLFLLVIKINYLLNHSDRTSIYDPTSSLIRSELRQLLNYSDLINNIDPNLFNRMKERVEM